jgi:hypothetical protein
MAISEEQFEEFDRRIRRGLSLWSGKERRDKSSAVREKQEERQAKAFEWKKEDREKKKKYEVSRGELVAAKSHIKAGNVKLGLLKAVDSYNKYYPDRNEAAVMFRSSHQNPDETWDKRPGFAGRDFVIISRGSPEPMPFKTPEEVMDYLDANLNPEEYLRASKESEAIVAKMNASEKPFQDPEDGLYYRRTWGVDSGGNPKEGPKVPYEGKREATKTDRVGLDIKQHEKIIGEKLTSAQKRKKLGYESKKAKAADLGKRADRYKKEMSVLLMRFVRKQGKKGDVGDLLADDGELTTAGENALEYAFSIVEKKDAGEKLTPHERRLLPYARKATDTYDAMFSKTAATYEPEENSTYDQYRTENLGAGGTSRTKLPPGEGGPQLGGIPPRRPAIPLLR